MGWLTRKKDKQQAFMEQVFVHTDGLHRYALRLTRDAQSAEDLVQDSLTKAFKAFDRLRPDTNHRAWVFTILRNSFISQRRKADRETPLEDMDVADPDGLDEVTPLIRRDDGYRHGFEDEVVHALSALSEKHRTAVVLCDVEGMTYEEVAVVMECPVGTVRSRIHHARKRLRDQLTTYATTRGYRRASR